MREYVRAGLCVHIPRIVVKIVIICTWLLHRLGVVGEPGPGEAQPRESPQAGCLGQVEVSRSLRANLLKTIILSPGNHWDWGEGTSSGIWFPCALRYGEGNRL